ncbi:MAG: hypothetical protein KKA32_01020 [Actinobacteria bacterium]|nr:hypothetical protein [Actinomycetota bacterium]
MDLTFSRTRKLFGCNQNQAMRQAFVAAGTLLGEQCLDEWIGAIDVGTSFSQPVPLPALADRVDAVVLGIADSLPPQPYFERIESLEWTVLKLKPETTPDYSRRDDLCVAVLTDLELWTAGNRDPGFCSHRFSRHGETFCYVKIDGADGLAGSALQNRGEIDEAICAALIKERLGCIIGGGTGLRYSYVDLAILRPERSIPVIQSVLQQAGVPPRTWIHFFDADLQSEWVRVLAETPEPPWQP